MGVAMRDISWLRRGGMSVCAVLCVAVLAVVPCVSASAVESSGLWYVDDTGVRDAWAQGITGKGVKVAVLDTDVVSDYPALVDADMSYRLVLDDGAIQCVSERDGRTALTLDDPSRKSSSGMLSTHGTEVASLIVGSGKGYDGNPGMQGVAPGASVTSYPKGFASPIGSDMMDTCVDGADKPMIGTNEVLSAAIDDGARVVNMSFGTMEDPDVDTYVKALRKGVIIVNARSNDHIPGADDYVGKPMDTTYFPGTLAVSAVGPQGKLSEGTSDTKDGNVTFVAPGASIAVPESMESKVLAANGRGNSAAAPMVSGYVALAMQRWPDATGNQILQALVRSTKNNPWGVGRLDPEHKYGYGQVDVAKLLATDPSQYPDINPLLEAAVTNSDAHEETRGMYTDRTEAWWDGVRWGYTDPFPDEIKVQRDAVKVGIEYERQKVAWAKVEACRADGGSDCMQYSATATADKANEFVPKEVKPDKYGKYGQSDLDAQYDQSDVLNAAKQSASVYPVWLGLPVWAWASIIVTLVLVVLAVVLAAVHHNRSSNTTNQKKRAE